METVRKMANYDWVFKSLLGMLGTGLSVALENVSTTISIVAGLLTCIYMVFQIIKANDEREKRNNS